MSELAVPTTLAGERLDRALALLTGWSRAEVARRTGLTRTTARISGKSWNAPQ